MLSSKKYSQGVKPTRNSEVWNSSSVGPSFGTNEAMFQGLCLWPNNAVPGPEPPAPPQKSKARTKQKQTSKNQRAGSTLPVFSPCEDCDSEFVVVVTRQGLAKRMALGSFKLRSGKLSAACPLEGRLGLPSETAKGWERSAFGVNKRGTRGRECVLSLWLRIESHQKGVLKKRVGNRRS